MAEGGISVDQDQFMCPVCLDLLQFPVTIPCGHSYCMSCITDCWNQKAIYSCPSCKQSFTPRPPLAKNVVLAEMVEKLQKTRLQTSGSGDVQMICPQHNKMLEVYCRTDQCFICVLCLLDEHKNHVTVSPAEERKEKQEYFEDIDRKINKVVEQREKDLQQLKDGLEAHERSAQGALRDSERIFTELIRDIEKRHSEVNQLIRDQERAAVSRAEEQLERLKLEINDLKRRNTELKQLSETQEHVRFLQSLSSVSLSGSSDSGFTVSSHLCFDDVVKSVSQFRDKLLQFSSDEIEEISEAVKTVQVIQATEDQTSDLLRLMEWSSESPKSPLPVNLPKPKESKPSPTSCKPS